MTTDKKRKIESFFKSEKRAAPAATKYIRLDAHEPHFLVKFPFPQWMLTALKRLYDQDVKALMVPSVATVFGKTYSTRKQALFGTDYWFGGKINEAHQPVPLLLQNITEWVRDKLAKELQCTWNVNATKMSYIFNSYETGDNKIGEHSDKHVVPMEDGRHVVYSVAWGETRKMIFRRLYESSNKKKNHEENCEEGIMYVMLYPQELYTHEINREKDKGERVSLTGRELIQKK